MSVESFFGGCIAFVCAGIALGSDAQTEVRKRFGRLYGTSILRNWPGYAFIVAWGVVDVGFYFAFLSNHDWAKRAFNVEVEQNLLWMGLVVGLSAVLIIRTNLATVGNFQIGGEYAYTWSRALLIDILNRTRARSRRAFITKYRPSCKDVATYPKYFTSLEDTLKALAQGSDFRAEIEQQLVTLRQGNNDPNTDAAAREGLSGLVYDYFGPKEVKSWSEDADYGNK